MKNLKYGIGIDVAMQKFDVCISVINEEQRVSLLATHSFDNSPPGFARFLQWTGKYCKEPLTSLFLMEATGVYYEQLAWLLHQKDKNVVIVLPNKARKYKESLGLKSKTDSIDAKGLAQMACEQYLKPWKPISKNIYQLRLITRQIERISQHITQFKAQLHALT